MQLCAPHGQNILQDQGHTLYLVRYGAQEWIISKLISDGTKNALAAFQVKKGVQSMS